MYSQLCLPHSIVIYCTLLLKGSKGKGTGVGQYRYEQVHTLTGNTAGKSRVAAETVELVQFPWCVCAFLFRAQSTVKVCPWCGVGLLR